MIFAHDLLNPQHPFSIVYATNYLDQILFSFSAEKIVQQIIL